MRAKPLQGTAHAGTTRIRPGAHRWRSAIYATIVLAALAIPLAAQEEGVAAGPQTHWTATDAVGDGAGPVEQSLLEAAPTRESWLHYGGNYGSWRHSPITELTPESASKLRLAWIAQTGIIGTFEATPIVLGREMYVTTPAEQGVQKILRLDALTGEATTSRDGA